MYCPGPCGEDRVEMNGGVFFNPNATPTMYRRGDKVMMKWTRNNHQSGFVRFTLVPKQYRMSKEAHDEFAFHYACWEAGERYCGPDEFCSTDEEGKMFETEVEIPRVYPDGEYTLGWSWYGGTRYRDGGPKAEYGDYYSCANIAIQGSKGENGETTSDPPTDAFIPVFKPGLPGEKETCYASVNQLGICVTEPCYARYPGAERVPAPFENNQTPPPILRQHVEIKLSGSNHLQAEGSTNGAGSFFSAKSCPDGPLDDAAQSSCIEITNFEVLDVVSGTIMASVDTGGTTSVRTGSHGLNVKATIRGAVHYVDFAVDGNHVRRELISPYFVGGDTNGSAFTWGDAPRGRWFTLTAKASGPAGESSASMRLFIDG